MALALRGSAGAIAAAAAATVSPTFAQATVAGNLLVAFVGASGSGLGTITTTASGWTQAISNSSAGTTAVAIWYKPNSGAGETAPTFTCTGATNMWAEVAEFSGAPTTSPVDRTAANNQTNLADTTSSDVALWIELDTNSKSATYTVSTPSWTPTGGTHAIDANTGATKNTWCFTISAYLLNTHGGSAVDAASIGVTPSTGTISSSLNAIASFKPFVASIVTYNPLVVSQAVPRAGSW